MVRVDNKTIAEKKRDSDKFLLELNELREKDSKNAVFKLLEIFKQRDVERKQTSTQTTSTGTTSGTSTGTASSLNPSASTFVPESDLNNMTNKQLKTLLNVMGIKGVSNLNKTDLIRKINEERTASKSKPSK